MMEFFEAVAKRRSVRSYEPRPFPKEFVKKALEAAVMAPNSSNMQTWDFYWVRDPEAKKKVSWMCMDQSAARTADQFVVVTADPKKWKRSQGPLLDFVEKVGAPKQVKTYYSKLVPLMYSWGILNSMALLKFPLTFFPGLFRPIMRPALSKRGVQEVAVKSAALAAENFMLAISAQGGATCPMEGFDEWRLRRYLKLSCSARIVMVISVGYAAEKGLWGPQFRLPLDEVVHLR